MLLSFANMIFDFQIHRICLLFTYLHLPPLPQQIESHTFGAVINGSYLLLRTRTYYILKSDHLDLHLLSSTASLLQDVLISAAVAEFKGPQIFGVVRLAQVSMELARIEANFSGLPPGKHGWSINEFGDLTQGVASTGKLFNPSKQLSEPLGDLGTLEVDVKGEAFFSGVKKNLTIADLIGRAIAVYKNEDRSDAGLAAAVVARSAGVGENYKKLCTCDGTTIWEATNADYVPSKV